MGMFDSIIVDKKWLPKDFDSNIVFQTKDLDCYLNYYLINEDGQLFVIEKMICDWKYETVKEPLNYTGSINFYDLEYEFIAWIVNGKVKEILKVD